MSDKYKISKNIKKKVMSDLMEYFDKDICTNIELGICEFTKMYCMNANIDNMYDAIYKDKAADILENLKNNSRTIKKLKSSIQDGNLDPYQLSFMKPEELDNDIWEKFIKRKLLSENRLNNLPAIKWKPCKLCKNVNHNFYQIQTRSADEPMTIFYICQECGKTTKINN